MIKKIISCISIIALCSSLLFGCSENKIQQEKSEQNASGLNSSISSNNDGSTTSAPIDVDFSATDDEMFSKKDTVTDYDENADIIISLNGNSASCSSEKVTINDNIITITEDGTYIIKGTIDDATITVNAPETAKPKIVLDNVNITSKTSASIYIKEADKVFITLAENSTNKLTNGGAFENIDDNNIDGVVFSKQDLTFNGNGKLEISSPTGHGIVCRDDLVFTDGNYTINSASHGIDANDSIRVMKAIFNIDAGKDGMHSENSDDTSLGYIYISSGTFNIEAEGDGISSYAYTQIEDGIFDILTGGGSENGTSHSSGGYGDFMGGNFGGMHGGRGPHGRSTDSYAIETEETSSDSTSMKGIKTSGSLLISNGNFTIDSADDSIHANNSIVFNAGSIESKSGDDAVHADTSLSITNATIKITESYEGLEAQNISITGGNIDLVASDDGLNAAGGTDSSGSGGRDNGMFGGGRPGAMGSSNGKIEISGGTIHVNASGDGIDSNGSVTISGGYTVVVGPTQGDTSTLDFDTSATITGGTFIGTGAAGMAHSFTSSENQGIIALSVGSQNANTEIILKDASGNTILSHKPELPFQIVILSSPDIQKGETYNISIGSQSGDFEAE